MFISLLSKLSSLFPSPAPLLALGTRLDSHAVPIAHVVPLVRPCSRRRRRHLFLCTAHSTVQPPSPHFTLTRAKPWSSLMYGSFFSFIVYLSSPPRLFPVRISLTFAPHLRLPLCFPIRYLLFCLSAVALRSRSVSFTLPIPTPTHPFPPSPYLYLPFRS